MMIGGDGNAYRQYFGSLSPRPTIQDHLKQRSLDSKVESTSHFPTSLGYQHGFKALRKTENPFSITKSRSRHPQYAFSPEANILISDPEVETSLFSDAKTLTPEAPGRHFSPPVDKRKR